MQILISNNTTTATTAPATAAQALATASARDIGRIAAIHSLRVLLVQIKLLSLSTVVVAEDFGVESNAVG